MYQVQVLTKGTQYCTLQYSTTVIIPGTVGIYQYECFVRHTVWYDYRVLYCTYELSYSTSY